MKNLKVAARFLLALSVLLGGVARGQESDSRLDPKLESELNKQINEELFSSYLYLSMAAYFEAENLPGFANWMRVQTQEETLHGMMFFDFVNERNGRVLLAKIEGPQTEWKSPLDAFTEAYEHEKHISARIRGLVKQARALDDDATDNFLQWFVAEQVEEENSTYTIVQQLKLIGDDRAGLFLIDRELAARRPAPAGAPAGAAP
jgi:ferritin